MQQQPHDPNLTTSDWEIVKQLIEKIRPYTLLGDGRLDNLARICAYLNAEGIPGDFIECGTYKGGSAAVLSQYLGARHLWLYDSFQGMPETSEEDGADAKQYVGDCVASLDDVLAAMEAVATPPEKFTVKQGWFEQTFTSETAQQIALLHCDADWYDSVTLVLEKFYPLIAKGGVVVLDDFGYWEGCREAFYDFCQRHHEKPLLERIGITQAYWIKGKTNNRILSVNSYQLETETKQLLSRSDSELERLRAQVQLLENTANQAQADLKKVRSRLRRTRSQLKESQEAVVAMQTSKFWKARSLWISMKSWFPQLSTKNSAPIAVKQEREDSAAIGANFLGQNPLQPSQISPLSLSSSTSESRQPDTPELLLERGNTLLAEGQVKEAILCYQSAVSLNSNFWEAYAQLSHAFQQINQIDDAILCQQTLVNLVPHWAEAHYGLGNLLRQRSRLDEALTSYERAIELQPDWAEVHYAKACIIQSAIEHNSREGMEAFYSNPHVWGTYVNIPGVLQFYDNFVNLGFEKGIEFDGKHIADVGCGTGHLLLNINQKFHPASLTGFEYSNAAIEVAKGLLPDAEFYWFDIYEPSDRTFDVVICTEVLEHLLKPDLALRNLLSMVNQVGAALIAVPNGRTDTFEGHINFWSPESWEVFIKSQAVDFYIETGLDHHDHLFAVVKRKNF